MMDRLADIFGRDFIEICTIIFVVTIFSVLISSGIHWLTFGKSGEGMLLKVSIWSTSITSCLFFAFVIFMFSYGRSPPLLPAIGYTALMFAVCFMCMLGVNYGIYRVIS